MWYLYVLELENGCFYVGITLDVDRRVAQHFNGEGSNFTRINKPIKVVEVACCQTIDRDEAYILENQKTIEYAMTYGGHKVKGGKYLVPQKLINKVAHLQKQAIKQNELPPDGGGKS